MRNQPSPSSPASTTAQSVELPSAEPPQPLSLHSQEVAPAPPMLAIVIPTYNERENISELIARLDTILHDVAWEVLFVDDDSPDGTANLVASYSRRDSRVRLLHRIHRRGLSSACIEGMLATTAPYIAVMDADMQHDEAILPLMLEQLCIQSLDLVIGTRNADGGSMGDFCRSRRLLSRYGQFVSQAICSSRVSDPMSGFFLLRRSFFLEVVHDLYGGGFKILLDILSSASRPVRFAEIGYTFNVRLHGESKLDMNTGVEYLRLITHKLTGGLLPSRVVVSVPESKLQT